MRRRHRRGNKQRKIIIGSMLCLLVLFTVGYSAFQTTLNVNVKGNVKKKTASEVLKENVVTTGDGLYKDTVTDGRYYYRGANPNNYITFNNETWRIISVESDGTLKIVRNEQLSDNQRWDAAGNRNSSTSTYCTNVTNYGCNAWVATSNLIGNPNEFKQYATNGTYSSGTVTGNSTIAVYLNETYYSNLSSSTKEKIVKGIFDVSTPGDEQDAQSLEINVKQEKEYQWKGYIALYTVTELLRASINTECKRLDKGYNDAAISPCKKNNWLWPTFSSYSSGEWTLSPCPGSYNSFVWYVAYEGFISNNNSSIFRQIRPVLHLSSDITLSGDGTSSSPYIIN